MNNSTKTTLIVIAALVICFGLIGGGFFLGRFTLFSQTFPFGSMMGSSFFDNRHESFANGHHGMRGGWGYGGSMMDNLPYDGNDTNVAPFSIDEAHEALEAYLESSGADNLEIGEIMIFSNHAYAQLIESDTGMGAMEVLVDPVSGYVSLEHGPNMMWNLKYGMHRSNGMGMMGSSYPSDANFDEPMPVSEEQAVELAQAYLDSTNTGLTADEHADPFYGYYTLHTVEDGQVVGMLSVNGYTGEVFLHTWHGDFIEMTQH